MANKPGDEKPKRINIELPADLQGIYANITLISHSPSEFILDFAQMLTNTPKAKIHSRIVMTPMNAKLLLRALGENLAKFEAKYGEIQMPDRNILLDRDRGFTS